MKVVFVAPVQPFRGGISHSATMSCNLLSKNHDVLAVSFSRLYPQWLYSLHGGRFQKDKNNASPKFKSVFILDSINPLTWVKAVRIIDSFNPEVIVFEWWTTYFGIMYWFMARQLKKRYKISVVCQNVLSHEERFFDAWLTKLFFSQASHFTCLDSISELKLRRLMGWPKLWCFENAVLADNLVWVVKNEG